MNLRADDTLPAMRLASGVHNFKLGGDVNYLSNSGTNSNRDVEIKRADGSTAQTIHYFTNGSLQASNAQAAAFAQDQWLILRNLSFDYGLRVEAQRSTAGISLMPRLAMAYGFASYRLLKGFSNGTRRTLLNPAFSQSSHTFAS